MIPGSPQWQHVMVIVAALWLLISIVRGWGKGLLRQLVIPVALIAAAVAVRFGVPVAVQSAAQATHLPAFLLFPVAFLGVWLLAYTAVQVAGKILFKRTRDLDSAGSRLIFGLGGAVLGLFFSLIFLWLAAIAIRITGRMAREQSALQGQSADLLVRNLAKLDASMELGVGRAVLDAIDPVPAWVYRDVQLAGQLVSDPRAIERFVEYPGFQTLWQSSKVRALQSDPALVEQARRGNLLGILTNPGVIAALQDPEVQRQLSSHELESALRYAVNGH